MLLKNDESLLLDLQLMEKKGTLKGVFGDIPACVYNDPRMPGIRSGAIKEVVSRSYSHYIKKAAKSSTDLKFGSQFHSVMEGDQTEIANIPSNDLLTMRKMKAKIDSHPEVQKLLIGAKKELTFFSVDSETGLLKRCRADIFNQDSERAWILDWKSTRDASPDSFSWDCKKYLYRISAAYYLEIVSEVLNQFVRDFYMVASEKEDPHECALYLVDQRSITRGSEEVRKGLKTFRRIYDEGANGWRGYDTAPMEILI